MKKTLLVIGLALFVIIVGIAASSSSTTEDDTSKPLGILYGLTFTLQPATLSPFTTDPGVETQVKSMLEMHGGKVDNADPHAVVVTYGVYVLQDHQRNVVISQNGVPIGNAIHFNVNIAIPQATGQAVTTLAKLPRSN